MRFNRRRTPQRPRLDRLAASLPAGLRIKARSVGFPHCARRSRSMPGPRRSATPRGGWAAAAAVGRIAGPLETRGRWPPGPGGFLAVAITSRTRNGVRADMAPPAALCAPPRTGAVPSSPRRIALRGACPPETRPRWLAVFGADPPVTSAGREGQTLRNEPVRFSLRFRREEVSGRFVLVQPVPAVRP